MKYIYILKTGETFDTTKEKFGDFDLWVKKFFGKNVKNVKVIDVLNNQTLPNLQSAKSFIITGSHSMVSAELPWSVALEKYIRKIKKRNIPLLGICYGHQLIAKALGGISGYSKKGKEIEIGQVKIKRTIDSLNDPLFKDFALKFDAYETHYQSAIKLPAQALVLAFNSEEKHQAVRFSKYIWGVQFHPEFDSIIMKEYILNQKEKLEELDFNVDKLLNKVKNCDMSNTILNNFVEFAINKSKRR